MEKEPESAQNVKEYTTDGKVVHFSKDDEINERLIRLIGPKFKKYRELWDKANKFEIVTDFPLFLHLELHEACNLKCPMCTQGIPELRAKYISTRRMSWETYERIIREGEEHGCPSVAPQGVEEPLMTRDLERYIRFAHDHGFLDIMLNTNATLLDEERSRKLLDSGLTRLRFSLDAVSKETFEKIRLGADYDVVMKNIETFLDLRAKGDYQLPIVGVSMVKMKWNEHEVDGFLKKWTDKVDIVTIQEFIPPDTDHDYSEFYPTSSHLREAMIEGFRCVQPWQRVFIHNRGELCPCCAMFGKDLTVGNINDFSIYDLWHSDLMNTLRQLHKEGRYMDNVVCLKCVNSILCKPNSTQVFTPVPPRPASA